MPVIALLLLVPVVGPGTVHAQEWRPQIRMSPHLFIQANILGVRPEGTVRLGGGTIEASEARSGRVSFAVDFAVPGGDHVSAVDVQISEVTLGEEGLHFSVSTSVDVSNPRRGPARIERARESTLSEGGSCLHQVYEDAENERSIVLTLTAETRVVPEVAVSPSSSRVIVFYVALSRMDASGPVPIETNVLRTFDGSSVAYSFTTAGADAPSPAPSPSAAPPPPPVPQKTPPDGSSSPQRRAADPKPPPVIGVGSTGDTRGAGGTRDSGAGAPSSPSASSASPAAAASSSPPGTPGAPPSDAPAIPHPPSPTLEAPSASGSDSRPGGGGEQLELTLLPTLSSAGVLLVEATLRGPGEARPGAGRERRVLGHKTQVLTNGSAFDLAAEGMGGGPSYRFNVRVEF